MCFVFSLENGWEGVNEYLMIDQRTFPPNLELTEWQHREIFNENLPICYRG